MDQVYRITIIIELLVKLSMVNLDDRSDYKAFTDNANCTYVQSNFTLKLRTFFTMMNLTKFQPTTLDASVIAMALYF